MSYFRPFQDTVYSSDSFVILPALLFQKLIVIHTQLQIAYEVCWMIFQHFPKIRNIQLVKNVS